MLIKMHKYEILKMADRKSAKQQSYEEQVLGNIKSDHLINRKYRFDGENGRGMEAKT